MDITPPTAHTWTAWTSEDEAVFDSSIGSSASQGIFEAFGHGLCPPVSIWALAPMMRLFPPGRVLCPSRPTLSLEVVSTSARCSSLLRVGPSGRMIRMICAMWRGGPLPPSDAASLVESPRQPVGVKRTGSTREGIMSSPQ
eukprot:6485091-Amphidinium_carterae.1